MLPVTALTAGLCAVLYLGLSVRAIASRRVSGIGLGTGEDRDLLRRVRAHANFAEYVPLSLILLGLLELNAAPRWFVGALGVALVAGRVLHAWGLAQSDGATPGRRAGMALTFGVLFVGAIGAIGYGIGLFPLR